MSSLQGEHDLKQHTTCGLTLRCVMYSCSVASPLRLKLVSCSTSALCAVVGEGVVVAREE